MSGRLENDSFKLLELKLNLEGNLADKMLMEHQKIYMTMFLRKEIFSANCILSYFGVALMIMI